MHPNGEKQSKPESDDDKPLELHLNDEKVLRLDPDGETTVGDALAFEGVLLGQLDRRSQGENNETPARPADSDPNSINGLAQNVDSVYVSVEPAQLDGGLTSEAADPTKKGQKGYRPWLKSHFGGRDRWYKYIGRDDQPSGESTGSRTMAKMSGYVDSLHSAWSAKDDGRKA